MSRRSVTRVKRDATFTTITGPGARVVGERLRAARVVYSAVNGRLAATRRTVPISVEEGSDRIVVFSGHFERVIGILDGGGFPLRIEFNMSPPFPFQDPAVEPPRTEVFGSTGLDVNSRNALRKQFVYRTAKDREEQLIWLLSIYRDARVHIVVKNREEHRRIARLAFDRLRERVWDGRDEVGNRHIHLSTSFAIDPHVHVLIVWDYTTCLTKPFQEQLLGFEHACCVAFRPYRGRLHGKRVELTLEACFGPCIDLCPSDTTTIVKVVVASYTSSAPRRKRRKSRSRSQAIWNNDKRNREVTELATLLAGTAKESKRAKGTAIVAQVREWLGVDERLPVAILVESKQHAEALGELLPKWRRHTTVVEPGVRLRTRLPSDDESQNEIITALYAADVAEIEADVILRADGGAISTERFEKMLAKVNRCDVAVVDFDDGCESIGVVRARDRVAEYGRLGWQVEQRDA